jgi:hypothetical protein
MSGDIEFYLPPMTVSFKEHKIIFFRMLHKHLLSMKGQLVYTGPTNMG